LADRIHHHPAGDADPVPIDQGTRSLEDFFGFLVCDLDPGSFQNFKGGLMELLELVLVDHG
jgi:hypothetical protein